MASPPAALALPVSAGVIPASLRGMGFESLPPLPIISKTFGFLKCVNLSSMGLGLNEVPSESGWDLVLWKLALEQSRPKGVLGPSEVQTEIFDVVDDSSLSEDSVLTETRFEPVFDMSESKTRPEPVLDIGEARIEPPLVFEENVDDFFDKVADFEKDERVETPIVIVQPKTIKIPPKWGRTKEEKSSCLFINLGLCKLKPLIIPHNPNLLHPKLLPNHPEGPTD